MGKILPEMFYIYTRHYDDTFVFETEFLDMSARWAAVKTFSKSHPLIVGLGGYGPQKYEKFVCKASDYLRKTQSPQQYCTHFTRGELEQMAREHPGDIERWVMTIHPLETNRESECSVRVSFERCGNSSGEFFLGSEAEGYP